MNGVHEITDNSLNAISGHSSGMMVPGRLLDLADREGAPFPPVGPVSFGVAPLAKAVGISRTQVRRILRSGAEAAHFVLLEEGRGELTPRLAEHVSLLGVALVLGQRWAAERVLAPKA